MQRVHPDDLCGHIMQNKHGFEVLSIPAIAMRDEEWKFSDGGVYMRKKGEPINPRRESIDQLKSLLHQMGAFDFNGQYLQGSFHPWTEDESRTELLMEDLPEGWSSKDGCSRRGGFFRITSVSKILDQVFDVRPDGPKFVPYEAPALDVWEAETMIQQAKLVAEVERSSIQQMEQWRKNR